MKRLLSTLIAIPIFLISSHSYAVIVDEIQCNLEVHDLKTNQKIMESDIILTPPRKPVMTSDPNVEITVGEGGLGTGFLYKGGYPIAVGFLLQYAHADFGAFMRSPRQRICFELAIGDPGDYHPCSFPLNPESPEWFDVDYTLATTPTGELIRYPSFQGSDLMHEELIQLNWQIKLGVGCAYKRTII